LLEQYYKPTADFVRLWLEKTERPEMGRRNTAGFRWRHMLRVLKTAREIGLAEGADLGIIELATLLHDVAKLDPRTETIHHAVLGSQIAEKYLTDLDINSETVARIVEAVRYHSYDTVPEQMSLETKVIKDADRLDEIGALGVIWVGIHAGRVGMDYRGSFRQGQKELVNLEQLTFYTETGKAFFEKRFKFIQDFWSQVEFELMGEKISPYEEI